MRRVQKKAGDELISAWLTWFFNVRDAALSKVRWQISRCAVPHFLRILRKEKKSILNETCVGNLLSLPFTNKDWKQWNAPANKYSINLPMFYHPNLCTTIFLKSTIAHLTNVSSLREALQALLLHLSIHDHPAHVLFGWNFCLNLKCHQTDMKGLIY